jgi:enoyl-CoA hydratase/carnithine racemase
MSTEDQGIESVLISAPPGLRVIDLNRPRMLNSLNAEMVSTLLPLVHNWQTIGGDVKLVAVRGTGGRAFCAGGDIKALHECASTGTAEGRKAAHDFFREEYTLNHAIGTSRVPFVSILDGIVMGGGVGLSVHGAFRVATENTIFAMPETGIGNYRHQPHSTAPASTCSPSEPRLSRVPPPPRARAKDSSRTSAAATSSLGSAESSACTSV